MSALHFLLNDREIHTNVHPATLVLDFLRDLQGLKGTKEGCREGDCGACAVLIGELRGEELRYRAVTSCLVPIGSLHGRHLVSIEGLNLDDLSPVQEAVVEEGASQCGFCTPGIVVSMTGSVMEKGGGIAVDDVKEALGGHLCRCTGYRSLKACAQLVNDRIGDVSGLPQLVASGVIPPYFGQIKDRLRGIGLPVSVNGGGQVDYRIAGGTDLYVQRGDELPRTTVDIIDQDDDLAGIVDSGDYIDVGAATTFEDFSRSPIIQEIVPDIGSYMHLIASLQIRNRATLGGNVINASPIGDMTILLLALKSDLVLRSSNGDRVVPMTGFYKGYKQMDLQAGEVLSRIRIPRPIQRTRFGWEKVSKRKTLDIATVNFAMGVTASGGHISSACLAIGGVAPVPLYLKETSALLAGLALSPESVRVAIDSAQDEISPISDIRGTARYKRLLAQQLMIAAFTGMFPDELPVTAFI